VSISVGILVALAVIAGLLKYYLFFKKRKSPGGILNSEFTYHAFIIYSNEDSRWVSQRLLPLLEEKYHLKCCIHYRDFTPGKPFQESMAESVYKSRKIIAVLSSSFLKSNYCNYELNIAKYRLLNRGDDSLVMIRIDDEDSSKLPRELRKRNFIDYTNPLERPLWEHRLLSFLNVPVNSSNPDETVQQNCDNVLNSNAFSSSDGNNSKNENDELNSVIKPTHVVYQTRVLIHHRSLSDTSSNEEQETFL